MTPVHKKPLIGILGAVGAGKSSVAHRFEQLGCGVVYADKLSHRILQMNPVKQQLIQWWGPDIQSPQGLIDREKVGEIVFSDRKQLDRLTALLHPLIRKEQEALIHNYMEKQDVPAVVLDIPLLLETHQQQLCDALVYVWAEWPVRFHRLSRDRGWSEKRIKIVENLQFTLDSKAKISDYTLCNNSSVSELARQVDGIFSTVLQRFRNEHSGS